MNATISILILAFFLFTYRKCEYQRISSIDYNNQETAVNNSEEITESYDETLNQTGAAQDSYCQNVFEFSEKIVYSKDLIQLRNSLLLCYDKYSRPLINSSEAINVKLGINIAQINSLDEDFQVFILNGKKKNLIKIKNKFTLKVMTSTLQISLRWNDEQLRWYNILINKMKRLFFSQRISLRNKSLFSNTISFKSNEIWVPDVIASNNVNNIVFDSKESSRASSNSIFDLNERNKYMILVKPNGDCRWVFPMKLMSNCQLDQQFFPFDFQTCEIDFRSSAYSNDQLTLVKFKDTVHLETHQEAEFDLIKTTFEHLSVNLLADSSQQNTTILRTKLLMKRKMVFYLNKIILPYFTFYVVTIFTYLLPVDSGEKKSYCTSILISGMIYLKDTSSYIPKTKELPLLSVYFNLNLIFIFICVISSTLVYTIYYMGKTRRPLPKCLKKLIMQNRLTNCISFFDGNLIYERKPTKKTKRAVPIIQNHLNCFQQKLSQLGTKADVKELIQDEINLVNEDLKRLKKNFDLKFDIFAESDRVTSPLGKSLAKPESNAFDSYAEILGDDILNLLKTLKLVIKQNVETKAKENVYLKNYESLYEWLLFCVGLKKNDQNALISQNQTSNQTHIHKGNKQNFHFLNTLENLKLHLVKPDKWRYKIEKYRRGTLNAYSDGYLNEHRQEKVQETNDSVPSDLQSEGQRIGSEKKAKHYLKLLREYKLEVRKYFDNNSNTQFNNNVYRSNTQSRKVTLEPDYSSEWKYLAIIIDRLIFFGFSIIIPVCLFAMYMKMRFNTLSQNN